MIGFVDRDRRGCLRGGVVIAVACLIGGWGVAQYPMLVVPDITIDSAASPARTMHLLLGALTVGAALLFPSLLYLYYSFKGEIPFLPFEKKR